MDDNGCRYQRSLLIHRNTGCAIRDAGAGVQRRWIEWMVWIVLRDDPGHPDCAAGRLCTIGIRVGHDCQPILVSRCAGHNLHLGLSPRIWCLDIFIPAVGPDSIIYRNPRIDLHSRGSRKQLGWKWRMGICDCCGTKGHNNRATCCANA